MNKKNQTDEFIALLLKQLPPAIDRRYVHHFLGGMIAPKTIKNAERSGIGPEESFRIGQHVVYPTKPLLAWIVKRYGLSAISRVNPTPKGQ